MVWPVLNSELIRLSSFVCPCRRKEAGENKQLNPFVRGVRLGEQRIQRCPVRAAPSWFDLVPTDLECDTLDVVTLERQGIDGLAGGVCDNAEHPVGGSLTKTISCRRGTD